MHYIKLVIILSLSSFLYLGCLPTDEVSNLDFSDTEREIAFPIINTAINVTDFERETESGNVSVITDSEGRVTVKYDGQVVSRDWSVISPPLPIAPFPFQESTSQIVVPRPGGGTLIQDEIINLIEFEEWNIRYLISHSHTEDLTITFTIPQITLNGTPYIETVVVPYQGQPVIEFVTDPFSLEGYVFSTVDNDFVLTYDARTSSGESVELDPSQGVFQPFNPSYVEGYLGKGEFPVSGNIVPVNLFSAWKSGGAVFENPSIDLFVENALGLPMSAEFEEFSITTVSGDTVPVNSQVVTDGIEINYPTLAQKGETISTEFSFNRSNSNIRDLFRERVQRVNYKITAVYNKDQSQDQEQFIGEGGFFSANVSVVLPLEGNINELVLQDTIALDLQDQDEVVSGELKTLVTNEFPLDLSYQVYFLRADGSVITTLYEDRNTLDGAQVGSDGVTLPADNQISLTTVSPEKWEQIQESTQMAFDFMLDTNSDDETPLWVYDQYDILIQMGAKLTTKLN